MFIYLKDYFQRVLTAVPQSVYYFVGFTSLFSDELKLLWVLSHAYPCSRHENWHTGDVLINLVGLLVNGFSVFLTVRYRSFSVPRKVPGPVCVPSFSIKSLTYFVFRLIAQEPTRGWRRGVNLTAVSFGAVCLSGDRSLCERVVEEVSLRLTDAC